jgi:hypothetical protein
MTMYRRKVIYTLLNNQVSGAIKGCRINDDLQTFNRIITIAAIVAIRI